MVTATPDEAAAQAEALRAELADAEDEIHALRRRLQESPGRVQALEERLLESKGQLAQATSQNEKLTFTLQQAKEQLAALREEVEKLTQPPAAYGTFLGINEDGTVVVARGGASGAFTSIESSGTSCVALVPADASPRLRVSSTNPCTRPARSSPPGVSFSCPAVGDETPSRKYDRICLLRSDSAVKFGTSMRTYLPSLMAVLARLPGRPRPRRPPAVLAEEVAEVEGKVSGARLIRGPLGSPRARPRGGHSLEGSFAKRS